MNKKGFVFIETVITVVVLSSALLALYSSFNAIIRNEEQRLYYDDVAYIYKTNYVREFLEENTDIENVKSWALKDEYIKTIGYEFEKLFTTDQYNNGAKDELMNIVNKFHIHQMVIVKSSMLDDCITYDGQCNVDDMNSDEYKVCTMCKNVSENENIDLNLKSYINTLNSRDYDYYLVVKYAEKYQNVGENIGKLGACIPEIDTNCQAFYVSLGI